MSGVLAPRNPSDASEPSFFARLRGTGLAWFLGLSNIPFALALGFGGVLPAFVQALVVGTILFLVPGLAWTNWRRGDAVVVLFRAVVASLVAGLAVTLVLILVSAPANRIAFLILLALLTNAGLWIGVRRGWYAAWPFGTALPRLLSIVAALFFVQCYLGAAYFVPALEDQDSETQGTAYGLMHELVPTVVTNRDTRHFFAHPLLLHFWIGESALISDDLERLRYYHEGSRTLSDDPTERWAQWETTLKQFEADPVLLPTRTPNLFLGALTLFPLGFLVYRLCGSRAAAVGACVVYATMPEIYVRTSYGGYLAVTNFLLTAGAYLYLNSSRLLPERSGFGSLPASMGRATWAATLLGGWADQKFLLLPLAVSVHTGLRVLLDLPSLLADGARGLARNVLTRPDVVAALLVGTGFVAGWAMFALYGLAVAPADFIQDHLKTHIWWRLNKAADVNLFRVEHGGFVYPSVVALWRQFAEHSGLLLVPPMLLGLWHAAPRLRQGEGLLLVWVLVGAVGFSLVDWRQTKHLAHILPPLAMLAAVYWASLEGQGRWLVGALLGVGVAWNLWRVGLLMNDFEYLKPLPIW